MLTDRESFPRLGLAAKRLEALGRAASTLLLVALGAGLATTPARAEQAPHSLIVAVVVKPADREKLRHVLEEAQVGRLKAWREQGLLKSYRLLFNRYADEPGWDALEVLSFANAAAEARWAAIERQATGGLPNDALQLATHVESTPANLELGEAAQTPPAHGVTLVIPYQVQIPADQYLHYFGAYVVPQMNGWTREGVLSDYQLHMARFPAGRPWASLLFLRYPDDDALARRDETVAKVRAELAHDPAWKAISDGKQSVRTEGRLAVADDLTDSDASRAK